jgi:cytochrome c oxidase subunit 2
MTGAPLSYLDADGPGAAPLVQLAWGLGGISVLVVAACSLALLLAIWRPRAPVRREEELAVPNTPGAGLVWIYLGLGITVPLLAACTVWSLAVLGQVTHPAEAPTLTIQVTAHQWWWEVRYLAPRADATFTTANEIHIPVGAPVRVELHAPDVIHSFWVPKLGGKMDLIPGITNVTWIQADRPGRYRGQCGEYCGVEHARMAFEVVAQSPAAFATWRARQAAPAGQPSGAAGYGRQVFQSRCGGCHTVTGTAAGGLVGPDLTHLQSRASLAAGALPNTAEGLADWIADPQAIKPGAKMPAVPMTPRDRASVVAYLQSLT